MLFQFDLFATAPEPVADEGRPLQKKARRTASGWQITDHACRFCFGRVLQRTSKGGAVAEARCAQCGATTPGGAQMLCACGADCGEIGRVLECIRNPHVTDAVPHEILIRERRVQTVASSAAPSVRPVKMREY